MNRRTFLGRLVAVLGAACVVKHEIALPARSLLNPVGSLFNPKADLATQYREGISIRFIRGFDIAKFDTPTRLDAFIVQPQLEPVLMCTCADWLTCDHPWPALLPLVDWYENDDADAYIAAHHAERQRIAAAMTPPPGRTGKTLSTGNWCGTQL